MHRAIIRTRQYLAALEKHYAEDTGGDRVPLADSMAPAPPAAGLPAAGVPTITLPPLTGQVDDDLLDAAGGLISQGEIDALLGEDSAAPATSPKDFDDQTLDLPDDELQEPERWDDQA